MAATEHRSEPETAAAAAPDEVLLVEGASLRIESAEAVTGYPGFNGDEASERAQAWVDARVDEMRTRYAVPAARKPRGRRFSPFKQRSDQS
jgi:hypothetical protein